jgi:hypothetical protein
MKLSEMKFEDIRIGQRVQSDNRGWLGTVSDKTTLINIDWDNGIKSHCVWHFWLDKVTIIEETK